MKARIIGSFIFAGLAIHASAVPILITFTQGDNFHGSFYAEDLNGDGFAKPQDFKVINSQVVHEVTQFVATYGGAADFPAHTWNGGGLSRIEYDIATNYLYFYLEDFYLWPGYPITTLRHDIVWDSSVVQLPLVVTPVVPDGGRTWELMALAVPLLVLWRRISSRRPHPCGETPA